MHDTVRREKIQKKNSHSSSFNPASVHILLKNLGLQCIKAAEQSLPSPFLLQLCVDLGFFVWLCLLFFLIWKTMYQHRNALNKQFEKGDKN